MQNLLNESEAGVWPQIAPLLDAAMGRLGEGQAFRIVGAKSLARAYGRAFQILGRDTETLDGTEMVVAGLVRLARKIGFLAEAMVSA